MLAFILADIIMQLPIQSNAKEDRLMKQAFSVVIPIALFSIVIVLLPLAAFAGSLDSPGVPGAGSGMPTLSDIYDQLNSGLTSTPTGSFHEPISGPTTSTHRSLTEIKAKLPAPDMTNGAAPGDVVSGKTFWGLRTDGSWGLQSGSALVSGVSVTGVNGSLTVSIPAGNYPAGKTATATDANLDPYKIKPGETIFGVTGKRWKDLGNGTVQDMKTDLVWQQADDDTPRSYDDAVSYCNGLSLAGGGWWLPESKQLWGITVGVAPVLLYDPGLFIGVNPNNYWSSTTDSGDTTYAIAQDFYMFISMKYTKTHAFYVRCVRLG